MDKRELKKLRDDVKARGLRDPYTAFSAHRRGAERRGVVFKFTFDEWWAIWVQYYHLRGAGTNGLCMGRFNDAGAYEVGNVYLTTNLGNLLDARKTEKFKAAELIRAKAREMQRRFWGRKGPTRDHTYSHTIKARQDWDENKERMQILLDENVDM